MASRKKIRRILHRGAKANSTPIKGALPDRIIIDDDIEHRPDPDYPGFCWCGQELHQ
jgi:hypothetical protein